MYIKRNERKNGTDRKFKNTWIETHTHFHLKQFEKDRLLDKTMKNLFGRSKLMELQRQLPGLKKSHVTDRVKYAVNVAISYESNENQLKLVNSGKYRKHLYFVSGIHPNSTAFDSELDNERYENLRDKYIRHKRCVGIGETGLDYNRITKLKVDGETDWDHIENRAKRQMTWFRNSIKLSIDTGKPLVLHIRNAKDQVNELINEKYQDAYKDAIAVLKEYFGNENNVDVVRGVCHSFNGSRKQMEELINFGFYIGVNGMMTRPGYDYLRSCIEDCPINKIVVETDSPYLSPFHRDGSRGEAINTPANIPLIGQWIADIKGMPVTEVQRITTENALTVFPNIR